MINCIGEKLKERDANKTKEVVFRKTQAIFGVYMYDKRKTGNQYLWMDIYHLESFEFFDLILLDVSFN